MNDFNTLLIANRGEIAVRIIKTAKSMGYETVAVFSEADREALHVSLADKAICIGASSVDQSYLNIDHIINAATRGMVFYRSRANLLNAASKRA
jgi:geranyl-CoA carboxylase alpha subunit